MENKYPIAEKQGFIVGTPFKVLTDDPKDVWLTNYAYYQKQVRTKGSLRPLMGRKTADGKFEVYIDGGWQEKDLWKDFSEEAIDMNGAPIMIKGRPKKNLLFDNKKEWLLTFSAPITISYYDTESKQKVTNAVSTCFVRLSKSVSEKLQKQISTMAKLGVDKSKSYFMMKYDPNKAPAEQYEIEFDHKEE